MSGIRVNTLTSPTNILRVRKPNVIYAPGNIIQVAHSVVMERFYYGVPNNDGGNRGDWAQWWALSAGTIALRPLDISITPTSPDSYIHVEWNIFYECNENVNFIVLRDDSIIGTQWISGTNSGRWVGVATAKYDNNNDSTPHYMCVSWIDRPGTTQPVTYNIGVRSSNSSNYTLTLNTPLGNYQNGADAYEQGVSFAIAQEIAA